MKNLFNAAIGCNTKTVAEPQLSDRSTRNTVPLFFLVIMLGTLLFTACKKQDVSEPKSEFQSVNNEGINADAEVFPINNYTGLDPQTLWELQQARAATAKYRNINNAFADGYADINVVVPNMGYHFMKAEFVDSVFDIRKPEILVYNRNVDGSFQLEAVEYAVPIALSPNAAPEGFTGSDDVWEHNTTFGLWLQHAWIWTFNPAGVFHDTNPLVQVH